MRRQQGSRQRKRRARHTKRCVLGRFLDLRNLSNRVAGLADRTDTRQARQQLEDAVGKTIAVHNRGGTRACAGRDLDRDVHLTYVERALIFRQVIPCGISVDPDRPLTLTSRVGGCLHVEGVLVQRVCRVCHQVAVPHQGWAGAQVRGLVGGVAASSEAGFGGDAVVDKHLRRGILEACQQLRNRLVLARNASNRNRARDDAHLVSGVALILCLPQGVLAKPGLQIRIQCRDPRHRLRVGVVQADPPRRIARGNHNLACLRVVLQQGLKTITRGDLDIVGEEGRDLTVVGSVQACLDALQQRDKARVPGLVDERIGELDEALDPLGVRHRLHVAEVGLRRLRQCLDDLFAVRRVLLNIQRGDKPRRLGKGVVQVVQVCQQVRLRRRHTGHAATAADPTAVVLRGQARRIHEQLLDRIRGLRLLRGHSHGADEHTIHRHRRQPELLGPTARDQFRGTLRRVHATADGEHRVVVRADLGVGLQQHVLQINPGVVAASMAVLHHQDDLVVRVRRSDCERVADLLRCTGLERNVREAILVQLREQLCGLVDVRNARGDTHAVKRSTSSAGLWHHARLAELQVPQEAVEEHGVELRRATRLQKRLEVGGVLAKLLLGVHAATGKFCPVAGVGSSGDDLAVCRRRRHATQDDWGQASQRRELRLRVRLAVRQRNHSRRVVRIVHALRQLSTRACEVVAFRGSGCIEHCDAGTVGQVGHNGCRRRIKRENVARTLGNQVAHDFGEVESVHQNRLRQFTRGGGFKRDPARVRPLLRQIHTRGVGLHMEGVRNIKRIEHRRDLGAAVLHFQLGVVAARSRFDVLACLRERLRAAGQHHVAVPIDHADRSSLRIDDKLTDLLRR